MFWREDDELPPPVPYIKAEGSRLTELAAQARMTLPAMSELVDDLQRLSIVERRADPRDGRAKLICLTDAGWEAMRTVRRIIAVIEADYARLVGHDRFEAAAQTLNALLRALTTDPETRQGNERVGGTRHCANHASLSAPPLRLGRPTSQFNGARTPDGGVSSAP